MVKMRIQAKGLCFSYGDQRALVGVDLEVGEREIVGVVGPNGSGKSTLLKCLNGKLTPISGSVLINGNDVRVMKRRQIARLIAVVPQLSYIGFSFRVSEIVLMGRICHSRSFRSFGQKDFEIARWALDSVGAGHLAERYITELSGGEYQRVIVARALAQEPEILLLDEPTLHLDLGHQLELLELIRKLVRSRDLSAVLALHDLNLALRYCDRLLLLHEGRIRAQGPPREVLTQDIIREVYGVEVEIVSGTGKGVGAVLPHSPVKGNSSSSRGARRG